MELTIQLGDSGPHANLVCRVLERSDCGDREENQDALAHRFFDEWLVCVLADGAGGHQGGETASRLAVTEFLRAFEQMPTLNPDALMAITHAVNRSILFVQQHNPGLADMHSTLCALLVNCKSGRSVCVHVGDSRVYHFSQQALRFRTRDHSVLQWMQDHQPDAGPQARNALYTALGEPEGQLQVAVSDVFQLQPGDWFLLCSDGLWEHFSDEELGLLGCNLRDSSDCCDHIHQLAYARAQGRSDNLSSVLLFIDDRGSSSG